MNNRTRKEIIDEIRKLAEGSSITFHYFAGSWCPMCVSATPVVMAMFNQAEVNTNSINVYSVNRFKSEPRKEINQFNITRVPTLVVEKDNIEIGRIIEYTRKTWEEDLLEILKN
ncbi:MAG: hypothetical protein Kapaf2KO_13010 [Candidatus Kapaibacteriales bacterium]